MCCSLHTSKIKLIGLYFFSLPGNLFHLICFRVSLFSILFYLVLHFRVSLRSVLFHDVPCCRVSLPSVRFCLVPHFRMSLLSVLFHLVPCFRESLPSVLFRLDPCLRVPLPFLFCSVLCNGEPLWVKPSAPVNSGVIVSHCESFASTLSYTCMKNEALNVCLQTQSWWVAQSQSHHQQWIINYNWPNHASCSSLKSKNDSDFTKNDYEFYRIHFNYSNKPNIISLGPPSNSWELVIKCSLKY